MSEDIKSNIVASLEVLAESTPDEAAADTARRCIVDIQRHWTHIPAGTVHIVSDSGVMHCGAFGGGSFVTLDGASKAANCVACFRVALDLSLCKISTTRQPPEQPLRQDMWQCGNCKTVWPPDKKMCSCCLPSFSASLPDFESDYETTYGHKPGTEVTRAVAWMLKHAAR